MREPTYFILAALQDEPRHGYAIIKQAEELSNGRVRLATGTLYTALDRLTTEAYIQVVNEEIVNGRARRYYALTPAGLTALQTEATRLAEAARIVTDFRPRPTLARIVTELRVHPRPTTARTPRPTTARMAAEPRIPSVTSRTVTSRTVTSRTATSRAAAPGAAAPSTVALRIAAGLRRRLTVARAALGFRARPAEGLA